MKTIFKQFTFVVLMMLIFSCKDILEDDISFDPITLNAPANNLNTVELTHTFWWDNLDGAEQYNMQIVEGTFATSIKLVLDTTIGLNKFNYTLYPGQFQWRVKGINNGSETYYTTFTLTIDSTNDITTQTVVLTSPNADLITNTNAITFRWTGIYIATNYHLDVRQNTWTGNSYSGFPLSMTTIEYPKTLNDGIYEWGVQAENSNSNTFTGFTRRFLTVDTGIPDTVSLSLPANNAILSNSNYTYTWTHPTTDVGPAAYVDSIFFYTDMSGTNELKKREGTANNYTDSLGIGIFYWRVRSSDEAGNIGQYTTMRQFTIQ